MTGGPRGDSEKPTFSSRNPHFFKIILEETLKENKLRVPNYFVKKCGETLTDLVFVKLPCGSKWTMKLENHEGKFWLEKGWPEFARHYNIGKGHMLIFRYDGNSELHAVIFDTSTVEIDYPSGPVHFDECNLNGKLRAPKREVIDDGFIEILNDCSPFHKTGVNSSVPCSPPPKRMKTSPTGKTQSNLSHLRAEGSHHDKMVVDNRMWGGNSNSKPEMKGKHDSLAKSDRDSSRQKKSKIPRGVKPLMGHKKYAALQKASGFKSKHPFFKILMQPSYVHDNRLTIPATFAVRYIKNKSCDMILKVLDGKTWSMKYTLGVYDRKRTARFRNGWRKFSRDNNLEVGDVCVFVLLKGIEIAFEVIIFRMNGNSKTLMSPAHEGGSRQVKLEESPVIETESGDAINDESRMPISHTNLPAKHANGCMSTPWKSRNLSSLKFIKKAKILQKVPFESEKPFFKFVIKSSYSCTGAAYYLYVPLDFATKYIKNEGNVVLSVPNGRSWSGQFRFRSLKNGRHAAEISGGWKDFKVDNLLKVGDICIFELLDGTKISFEVSIVRAGTRGGKSAKGASKQKGDVRVKTEID